MISQEQLLIERLVFECYQCQLEIKKSIDNFLIDSILSNSNDDSPISKEDDL